MTVDSDTKLAVLRGVYEDNLGMPRSSNGKRPPPGGAVAAGPPAPPDDVRKAADVRRAADVRKAAFGRAPWVVLLGLTLVFAYFQGHSPAGPVAAPGTPPRAAGPLLFPLRAAAVSPPDLLARAVADPTLAVTGTTEQYDAMLGHLGMPVADLFDLTVHTIVIDPGHGGNDPGATSRDGLREKDVSLDIARRLRDKLLAAGKYRVVLTRDEDVKLRLKERVTFAKEHDADLFISIHINSVPEEAGPVNYVETYYFGPHADSRTLALAESENRASDYAMGDFREIITRIGDTMKSEESAHLAAAIHERLYRNLRRHSDDIMDAGAKSGPFVVLLGVEVPSVLVEVSCISNPDEAARLSTPEYRDSVAGYLKMGVVEYLNRRATRSKQDGVNTQYVAQQEG